MTTHIAPLSAGDYEQLIAFLNRAFDYERASGFETLLPGLYQPTDASMNCVYAVQEHGRIMAAVGVYPIAWRLPERCLHVGGIGGVAVDRDQRGKGFMGRLLRFAVEQMRRDGCALSFLGGQRQRYRYYGWEVCGHEFTAHVTCANLKHRETVCEPASAVHVERFEGHHEITSQLHTLHRRQAVRCDRSADRFARFLRHWLCQPYLIRGVGGHVVGYAALDQPGGCVKELVLDDEQLVLPVTAALLKHLARSEIDMAIDPLQLERLRIIGGIAESITTTPAGNWQVLDWPTTLESLFATRAETAALPDGEVTIHVSDRDQRLLLRVSKGRATTEPTQRCSDLTASSEDWMRILFGPTRPSAAMRIPVSACALEAWCPLPLSIPLLDHV